MSGVFARAVMNPEGVRPFFELACVRRAGWVINGDSNNDQASSSIGHSREIINRLAMLLGLFATSVTPVRTSGEASTSGVTGSQAGANAFNYDGAPPEYLDLMFTNTSADHPLPRYGVWVKPYNPPTDLGFAKDTVSEILYQFNHINFDRYQGLRFHNWVWVPDSADRTFYPSIIRSGAVGGVDYPTGGVAVPRTVSGGVGVRRLTWDIPDGLLMDFSDPGNSAKYGVRNGTVVEGIGFRKQHWQAANSNVVSNYGDMYWCLENKNQHRGVQVSMFFQRAGMSAFLMAQALMGASDNAIKTYLSRLAELQVNATGAALPPVLMMQFVFGRNCASVANPSIVHTYGSAVGANTTGANSNTAAGTQNNYQSILNRVAYLWSQLGYSAKNIYVLCSTHVGESGDSALRYPYYRTVLPTAIQGLINDPQNARLGGITYIDSGLLLLTPEMQYGQKEQSNTVGEAANVTRYVKGFEDGTTYDPGQAHLRDWAYEQYWDRHFAALVQSFGGLAGLAGSSKKQLSYTPVLMSNRHR